MTGRDVLADVATLGRAFVVTSGPGGRPLADLAADPALLRARVLTARGELGTAEDRVAASWVFGGIAARVVAPALACVVLHGWVLDAGALRWHPWAEGIVPPLSLPGPSGRRGGADDLGEVLLAPLAAVLDALRSRTHVSARLLWGEVAVAAVKAGGIVRRDRPEVAGVDAAVGALLARAPLADVVHRDGPGGPFRRRTCCLAYRVPGGRTCADCVLGAARDGADVIGGRPC